MEVAAERRDKTILSCFLGVHGVYERLRRGASVVPSFSFPESAARALGQVASYAEWRNGPLGQVPEFDDCDRSNALRLVARKLESGDGWLDPASVSELLGCYGIASAKSRQVDSADDVRSAAEEIRKPVAVKVVSQSIVHKTDVGGVRLGLETPDDAEAAAKEIEKSLTELGMADELDGFLVQEMVTLEGAEMFVGVTQDPLFGPLLACGAGGTMVELIRDVSVRITPLTDLDAREMITSLKTYPRFEGYRGQPPLDRGAFEELLLRLSTMVEHLPAIADLDFNPVLVAEKGAGCMVLDARIKVASPAPERPRGARTVTGSSPHQNQQV
jgi:acyl-CoA synthetase (NDP forming)